MDFNKIIYHYLSLGAFDNWDEIKTRIPRILLWMLIIIPFTGYVFFGIRPIGNPLEPWIYGFGDPARRIKDAGGDALKVHFETNNNVVGGRGFRPGSTEGLNPEDFNVNSNSQQPE